MLNWIWFSLMSVAVICGFITGRLGDVSSAVISNTKFAIDLIISLSGMILFWLGILNIADKSGLVKIFAKLMRPIMLRLFPDVPPEHPAMGAMLMNITANMMGLMNAATPFGLRAMRELDTINPVKGQASNAMCMFLAINTSSVQLIPMSAILYLAANGNKHPTEIITTALFATMCSTLAAISLSKIFEKISTKSESEDDNKLLKSTAN